MIDRTTELRRRYAVDVQAIVLDLGEHDFIADLQAQTNNIELGLLVCNHMYTPHDTPMILDMPLVAHHRMLDINARAYTSLVHAYGPRCASANEGRL